MSLAKGVTFESVWAKIGPEEKRTYANQLVVALRELRPFTALSPQRVDGSPLQDDIISQCWPLKLCKTIPDTREKWLNNIDEELRIGIKRHLDATDDINKPSSDALYYDIRSTFLGSAPFVLTHGDLNLSNIIVHDGEILGIIHWESTGYYPWWVERWASYQHAVGSNGRELFPMVWAKISPELSLNNFVDKVYCPAQKTVDVYEHAPVEHTHNHDVWLRPRWCECKPYGGRSAGKDMGAELNHEIDYDVDNRRFGNSMKRLDREVAREDEVTHAKN